MNRIGYAVVNETLKPNTYKSCRLKSPYDKGIDFVIDRARHNVEHMKKVLEWNLEHDILLYRMSNDLIPLAIHPDVLRDFSWRWYEDDIVLQGLNDIKGFVQKHGMRITIHPDPFVVLNAQREEIYKRSIAEVEHLANLLVHCGGTDLVMYIGGQYGNPKSSMERFCERFDMLSEGTKDMVRIKNDDNFYTLTECLEVSKNTRIPVVFDYHHYKCNHKKWENLNQLIGQVYHTWDDSGLPMIVEIASGKEGPFDKKHGDYVDEMDMMFLAPIVDRRLYDLMVEAKKRELAVLSLRESKF